MRRRKAMVLVCAASLALGAAFLVLRLVSPTDDPPAASRGDGILRVASANLSWDNAQVREVSEVIAKLDADVMLVLEWTGKNLLPDPAGGPGWRVLLDAPSPSAHGVLLLARPGVEGHASLEPTPVPGPCPIPIATARLRAGAEWVSLLGVHAPPPIEECEDTNLPTLRYLAGLAEHGRMARDLGVARRGDRVVLAGDLNAPPVSPGLGWLRGAGLVDTYAERRWLPRGTWASTVGPHLVRLDYVLVSRGVTVLGSWTVDLPGSDHRAVIADLRIPERPAEASVAAGRAD